MTKKHRAIPCQLAGLESLITGLLLGLLLASYFCAVAAAQTAVVLMPVPKPQYFSTTGLPLASGCVFTYQQNSTTPLATYTDATGTVQNTNPVILNSSGFPSSGGIWIQAGQGYTIKAKSNGGSNCASGSTIYTVDGVGGGAVTLTTNVTYSATPIFAIAAQNQLFKITLTGNATSQPLTAVGVLPPGLVTWEITQDVAGAHTFAWPANSVGGCTIGSSSNQVTLQHFIWDGTTAIATGPCTIGNGPLSVVGGLIDTGLTPSSATCTDANKQLTSACSSVSGVTYNGQAVSPGGTGNVNAGAAAHSVALNEGAGAAIAGLALGANAIPLGQSGADPIAASVPTCSTDQPLTFGGSSFTCLAPAFGTTARVALGADTGLTGNVNTTILTESVTMPASTGTYRVLVQYGLYITAGANACAAQVVDATNARGYALSAQNANGSGYIALTAGETSAQTYAQSASATFNLVVVCNANTTATKNSGLFSFTPNEVSFLSVTPVLSQ